MTKTTVTGQGRIGFGLPGSWATEMCNSIIGFRDGISKVSGFCTYRMSSGKIGRFRKDLKGRRRSRVLVVVQSMN